MLAGGTQCCPQAAPSQPVNSSGSGRSHLCESVSLYSERHRGLLLEHAVSSWRCFLVMPMALSGCLSTQMCSGVVSGRKSRKGRMSSSQEDWPAVSPDCIKTIVGRQRLVARLMSGFIFLSVLSSGGCSRRKEEGAFRGSWTVLCKQVPPDSSEGAGGSCVTSATWRRI